MLLDYLNVEFNVFINKYEDDFRFILISAAVFVGKYFSWGTMQCECTWFFKVMAK